MSNKSINIFLSYSWKDADYGDLSANQNFSSVAYGLTASPASKIFGFLDVSRRGLITLDCDSFTGIPAYASQNEQNMKTVNDIYLNNFAQGYYELSDDDLAALLAIAQQCYVVGGPSVFQARSMYWIATNTSDMGFQDDCIASTGGFKTRNPAKPKEAAHLFKAYPNPLSREQSLSVVSSDEGIVTFYNILGQQVMESKVKVGVNMFDCQHFNCQSEFLFYKAEFYGGRIESGKVSIAR